MSAILRAPVDLLWNGGIGTYVKAKTETHADVGDKANDALRVNGSELRAKVVGEGGNLGFTQRGRIEFALGGGQGQHRRDRQRRRRQLLRPRGQHQGPARHGRGRGRHDRQAAQRAAGGDDRRGRRARAARLLHADAGALARARAGARDARGARARDARPRGRGPAGPRARGAAGRRDDRRAAHRRARPHAARAGGDAGLQQDRAVRGAAGLRPARGSGARRRAGPLLPVAAARALRRRHAPAPPEARDRRHARDQRPDRPRGDDVRVPPARGHRRVDGGHRARLGGRARRVRRALAVGGRRGARRRRRGRDPVRHAALVAADGRALDALAAALAAAAAGHRGRARALRRGRDGGRRRCCRACSSSPSRRTGASASAG